MVPKLRLAQHLYYSTVNCEKEKCNMALFGSAPRDYNAIVAPYKGLKVIFQHTLGIKEIKFRPWNLRRKQLMKKLQHRNLK